MRHLRTLAVAAFVTVAGLLAAGCRDGRSAPAAALDKAARDSVLAASPLPGAGAVRGALDVADTAGARAARADGASRR